MRWTDEKTEYEEKLHELIKNNEEEIGALECFNWGFVGQQQTLMQLKAGERRLGTVCREYVDAKCALRGDRIWRFPGLEKGTHGERLRDGDMTEERERVAAQSMRKSKGRCDNQMSD